MPVSKIKRNVRKISRRAKSWSTIAQLTLRGNAIEKNSNLKNCKDPILMIYGFGATRRTLAILENRLRLDGHTIFSLNLGGLAGMFNTQSIEELALFIDNKIEKIYTKYKIRGKLSIVGHSKGGLIGEYYIKRLNGRKRVKTFITLGTPFQGTPWCTLAKFTPLPMICKSLGQMAPSSEFLTDMRETPFPKSIRVYSIYSKGDTVCPFPVSVLDDKPVNVTNIEIFGNITHSELLIKKAVFNAIKHSLKHKIPESWTEASKKNYQEHLKAQKNTLKIIKGLKK